MFVGGVRLGVWEVVLVVCVCVGVGGVVLCVCVCVCVCELLIFLHDRSTPPTTSLAPSSTRSTYDYMNNKYIEPALHALLVLFLDIEPAIHKKYTTPAHLHNYPNL